MFVKIYLNTNILSLPVCGLKLKLGYVFDFHLFLGKLKIRKTSQSANELLNIISYVTRRNLSSIILYSDTGGVESRRTSD